MPDAAAAPDLRKFLPRLAGNRHIEDHQSTNVLRMGAGVGVRNGSAPIVADEEDLLEAELAHQLIDIVRDGALVVAGGRPRRIADPAHIRSNYGVALGERRYD